MNLRELVDTVDVPETRVAEGTWERARGRVRRRRVLACLGAGVVVATVAVAVSAMPGRHRADGPAPLDTPTPTPSAGPASMVVTRPDWGALAVNRVPAPWPDATPLSEDPVDRASLVMADSDDDAGAYVLGDDGDWRRLDVDGLEPLTDGIHTGPFVRPTVLNVDATRLALPQPHGLVVVDLTTGESRRYDVGRVSNQSVLWVDDDHVLVIRELATTGTIVDLDTSATEPSTYGPSTRVLPDGSALTWGASDGPTWMEWSDGRMVRAKVSNGGSMWPEPPLVQDGVAVGVYTANGSSNPDAGYAEVLARANGVAAVDTATGSVIAAIPLGSGKVEPTTLLGWAGDLPVLSLEYDKEFPTVSYIVAWDYRAGVVHPLAELPSSNVAWGVGL